MAPFQDSPNVLFAARVCAVRRPSPGFARLTLTGPHLDRFGAYGLDQRIKILMPSGPLPEALDTGGEPLGEADWRARLRSLPAAERPAMRSYTVAAARPADREVDIDFYLHSPPGPAGELAARARGGERLLLSGPDAARGRPCHGIQWHPGPAARVLLAGDETAFPAIRNILASLDPAVRAEVIVEAGDPADAAWPAEGRPGAEPTAVLRTGGRPGAAGGEGPNGPLRAAVEAWSLSHGGEAAALGTGFYAWLAAESTAVARMRDRLRGAGIAPDRVHAQGYWNAKGRTGERRARAAAAGGGKSE
ncbi:siderophore-interacting protein [Nocardiopsis potens]|uniref:siderophore-interacting protein n=1 Tax=Nocardiopsis potens TaxID=1246458 RepID=UPI00034B2E4F|nr:siderophore-interacting protein [Nocardiopsis potens]